MQTIEERRAFVDEIRLPDLRDRGPAFETMESPPDLSGKQAVAVGAQMAEFSARVAPKFRSAILNAMLLAQLAADKAAKPDDQVFDWYEKYVAVLRSIGWRVGLDETATKEIKIEGLTVHKGIIPVITAALGPAVAAASLIVTALTSLQEMDADQPWITLFDRNSRHVHGAKFQVSYIDADTSGDAKVTLLCFAVQASRTITQVLFFKFADEKVSVRETQQELWCREDNLPSDAIAGRVRPYLAENVAALDI